MSVSIDLTRDLVARERATTAALHLVESGSDYAGWAKARYDRVLDSQAEKLLHAEVLNLLGGLGSLLADEDFWLSFEVRSTGTDAEQQLEALHALTRPDLAAMFEMAGYTVPPPPPVDELIDATRAALRALDADQLTEERLAQAVQRAQADLTVLIWRARRQISQTTGWDDDGDIDARRTVARAVVRGARAILPPVVAAGVGVGVGAAVGPQFGIVAGAASHQLTEKLLENGLDRLLGSALLIGGQIHAPPDEVRAAVRFDPIALHLARMRSLLRKPVDPWWSAEALQHMTRVADLLAVQGQEAAATNLRHLAECLRASAWGPKEHLEDAVRTVESPKHPAHRHSPRPAGR